MKNLVKKLTSKRALRFTVPLAIVLLFVAAIVLLQVVGKINDERQIAQDVAVYKGQLRSQVESEDGTPNSGRDPASQSQTSLTDAASKPSGAGTRTDTPAAGVTGGHDTHDAPTSNANQTGISSAGCYVDYGIQGQQCLPAHAAGADGKLTCAEARMHFASGVKVTGTDRFKLDANGDGLACGSGE